MPAPPKPERRGPKPRKPIARSKEPIARRSRPAAFRRTDPAKEKLKADREWARAIRAKGRACYLIPRQSPYFHVCDGQSEAAHVHSRRFRATRHDLHNGLHICHWFHAWMTKRPKQWEAFCRAYLGADLYEELRQKALAGPRQGV